MTEDMNDLKERLRKLVVDLADQQAAHDNWWAADLDALLSELEAVKGERDEWKFDAKAHMRAHGAEGGICGRLDACPHLAHLSSEAPSLQSEAQPSAGKDSA